MNKSNISRDHLAMVAMRSIIERSINNKKLFGFVDSEVELPDEKEVAEAAYDYADAMMAERKRRREFEEED